MISFITVGQWFTIYVGLFIFITGIVGSTLQMFIFITTTTYRKTPCTFYLFVAAVHDFGQLISSLAPYVITAYLNIDINRISISWCKLRFFLASSFGAIPLSCACLATIDQFLITCRSDRFRQWSTMKLAHRASLCIVIVWWLHGTLWIFLRDVPVPTTALCVYTNTTFFLYATIFIFLHLCALHTLIMIIFAVLCYRNIRRTTALARRNFDRQLIIMVYMQAILTFIGLTPYGVFVGYMFITADVLKTTDRRSKEMLANAITYTFAFITYGVCNSTD